VWSALGRGGALGLVLGLAAWVVKVQVVGVVLLMSEERVVMLRTLHVADEELIAVSGRLLVRYLAL
jgi:hypothetical protein